MEMSLTLSLLLLFLAVLACLALYKYCYQPYHVINFKKCGIPGPTPLPFLGNFLLMRKHGAIHFPAPLLKNYGPVSRMYVGAMPVVVIGDVDLVRFLLVENNFTDREGVPDFFTEAVGLPPGLFMSRGEEWKQSRRTLAPAFSARNIRAVADCMESTCLELSDTLKAYVDINKSVQIDKLLCECVMEWTIAMVFGEVASHDKKALLESATVLWTTVGETVITLLWFSQSHFPWLGTLIGYLMKFSSKGRHFIKMYEVCTKLVLEHKKKKMPKTIVSTMLESQIEENGHLREPTNEEIVSQTITFLMAGFETTSENLGYTAYLLALNPEVQEKAHDHIVKYFESKPNASLFDAAREIEYIDMVIQESLRLFPPAPGLVKHCSKTVRYNEFTIPKDSVIYAAVQQIHHDPQYWPEPEKFIPERFSQEEKAKRQSDAHIPFGMGPRNCIGSRFALLQVKMMVIQMLRVIKFVQAPDTEVPLKTFYRLTVVPKNGIFLRLESRQ